MQIYYRKLAPDDWPHIQKEVMSLQNEFFGNTTLLEDEETHKLLFTHPESITFGAYAPDSHLVGFITGLPATYFKEMWGQYYTDVEPPRYHYDQIDDNSMHISFIDVERNLQNKGIGTNLLSHMIQEAKKQGYESVTGHFISGSSARIMEKFNPQYKGDCPNFFSTGDDYTFYKLHLYP